MGLDATDLTCCNHALYLFIIRADRQGNDYLIDLLALNDHLEILQRAQLLQPTLQRPTVSVIPGVVDVTSKVIAKLRCGQNTAYEVVGPVVGPDEEETTDIAIPLAHPRQDDAQNCPATPGEDTCQPHESQ